MAEQVKNIMKAMAVQKAMAKDITAVQTDTEVYEKLVYAMGDFCACLNEMVESEMIDALALFEKSKYYHHQNKMHAKEAKRELSLRVQRARACVKNKGIYLSYVDTFYDYYKKDVKQLYWSIRQEFTKHGLGGDEGDMFARLALICILLELSCQCFDDLIADGVRKCHVNFKECFEDRYRVGSAYHHWQILVHTILERQETTFGDINLNESADCKLAFEILYNKLKRGEYLDAAAMQSMQENYDSLDDEMKEAYDNVVKAKLKEVEQ